MDTIDIPMHLSYLNVTLKGLTEAHPDPMAMTSEELEALYKKARTIAEQPIEKIIADATEEFGENVRSLLWHQQMYGEMAMVPVDKLCFDDGHEFYGTLHGVPIKRGNMHTAYYAAHKDLPGMRRSINFLSRHKAFFQTHLPIMVRPYGDVFEVADGNHRAFTSIKDGDSHIPALLCTRKMTDRPQQSLTFDLVV